jgi:hypothetical protein
MIGTGSPWANLAIALRQFDFALRLNSESCRRKAKSSWT